MLLAVLQLLVAGGRCQDVSYLQEVVERQSDLIEQLQTQLVAFNQRLGEWFSDVGGGEARRSDRSASGTAGGLKSKAG